MEINDKDFAHIVEDIDTYFADAIVKYKMPPMMMVSVVMARIALLSKSIDGTNEFMLLLERARQHIIEDDKDKPNVLH